MSKIVGFVSHAFSDEYHADGKNSFREAIKSLFNKIENRFSNKPSRLTIEPYFDASEYNRPLPSQLRNQLKHSDFLLADISVISHGEKCIVNENVLYEIGFAMALKIPVLLVRRHIDTPPPADIRDLLACSYNKPQEIPNLLEATLTETVARILNTSDGLDRRGGTIISRTWFDQDVSSIHIICTPEPEPSRFASQSELNYLFLDTLEDRDALLEISTFLSRQYPNARLLKHSSNTVPRDVLAENIVVLGGPGILENEGNQVTKELMSILGCSTSYCNDLDGIEFANNTKFLAEFKQGNRIKTDWGCFMASQNPMNPYSRVIACHGIYTYGTLASTLVLSDSPTAMTNHLLLQDIGVMNYSSGKYQFEAIFPVQIVANGTVSPPKLKTKLIKPIIFE